MAAEEPIKSIKLKGSDFTKIKLLGQGAVSRVYLVAQKNTDPIKYYAMKIMNKQEMIQKNKIRRVLTERNILMTSNHPFIVKLLCSFTTINSVYIVVDYCPGGDLYSLIKREGTLSEEKARFYASEIVLALEYLHHMGIIYRDLKPENILIQRTGHIKLADFDLSKSGNSAISATTISNFLSQSKINIKSEPDFVSNSFVGTEEYISPEIISGTNHTFSTDWWALGILLYEMLHGHTPFKGDTREITFQNINNHHFTMNNNISKQSKNIIKKLLKINPQQRLGSRLGVSEIKGHKWFRNVQWALEQTPVFVPDISNELDTRYFRKLKDPYQDSIDMGIDTESVDISEIF